MLMIFLFGSNNLYAADLEVQVTKQSDWNSGFCSDVSVSNPTDNREEWNISFNAEGIITNLWNANYFQNSTTLKTIAHGVGWNDFVEPHSSITFGYCADKVSTTPPPSPPPPSNGDLEVIQTPNAQWDGGFCKNVQVKNTTDHEIDWEVNFPINGTVTTSWSSNFSQNPDTLEATASGVDWNNLVQPNAQVEFGYCANEVTPQVSDADIVSSDMAELTFNAIRLANSIESEITSNLNLMSSGSSGSTISWTSTNSAISSTGVVTRPNYESEDITV
jgi:hypothetical protein